MSSPPRLSSMAIAFRCRDAINLEDFLCPSYALDFRYGHARVTCTTFSILFLPFEGCQWAHSRGSRPLHALRRFDRVANRSSTDSLHGDASSISYIWRCSRLNRIQLRKPTRPLPHRISRLEESIDFGSGAVSFILFSRRFQSTGSLTLLTVLMKVNSLLWWRKSLNQIHKNIIYSFTQPLISNYMMPLLPTKIPALLSKINPAFANLWISSQYTQSETRWLPYLEIPQAWRSSTKHLESTACHRLEGRIATIN